MQIMLPRVIHQTVLHNQIGFGIADAAAAETPFADIDRKFSADLAKRAIPIRILERIRVGFIDIIGAGDRMSCNTPLIKTQSSPLTVTTLVALVARRYRKVFRCLRPGKRLAPGWGSSAPACP